ncbi:MAG: hypothetical protein H6872_04245 [Methylobacteriaceae bacterium]|nr:hypothetical protein [Methylobacteriaceae bacterium]
MGAAAAGFCLYWGWKFTRSIVGSLLSTSNNLLQVIFKVGAYWCARKRAQPGGPRRLRTVPLEEYLKVGVSIVCWIGMATSYLAYRRAADHPLPVVSATSQAPATPLNKTLLKPPSAPPPNESDMQSGSVLAVP